MQEFYISQLFLSISIGCVVFLVQQTDFVYEYSSMFLKTLNLKKVSAFLKFDQYENSNSFENYIMFIGAVCGVKKNIVGFLSRLITCFLCLNCFFSFLAGLLITKNIMLIMPSFLISVVVFYILFLIKRSVFK
jgi:hypothetical protein